MAEHCKIAVRGNIILFGAAPFGRILFLGATRETSFVAVDEPVVSIGAESIIVMCPVTSSIKGDTTLDSLLVFSGVLATLGLAKRLFENLRLLAEEIEATRDINFVFLLKERGKK